ncbi:MAG: cytochrome c [Akkermansiaceae bacterium]|nr:cytochrome c [Akkermansiaceae bacterium]
MDTANDNPLKRFSSFWLGVLLFGVFGLMGLLLAPWFNQPVADSFDTANAERRAEIRAEVDETQKGSREAAAGSFEKVGASLLATEAAPVEREDLVLPGSPTAEAKTAGGAAGIGVPDDFPRVSEDAPVEESVMAAGKTAFALCMACHGPDANGVPNVGPPLAGSEWVNGPPENLIAIQLRGLSGPIEVKGQTYNFIAPMVPQAFQTDDQIAAVLTYIRNSFGNKAAPVTPEQVKALRGEVGKPMLTQADLIPPTPQ